MRSTAEPGEPSPGLPAIRPASARPALQPLVLGGEFDFSDLRLWTKFAGDRDGTQNVTPNAGSGSWKYSNAAAPADRIVLGQHCVHLPAPGRYRLNGRGHAGGYTFTLIAADGGVVNPRSISAWFDDITRDFQGDVIFADGFQ